MFDNDLATTLVKAAFLIPPAILAITLHEAAHGWVASKLGDQTARSLGRITANPLKHIDPIGTVILPAVTFILVSIPFGWAKPVPVNWNNLGNPRKDMALVALAGPVANFIMALLWALVLKIGVGLDPGAPNLAFVLVNLAIPGIIANLVLMVLNLMPMPPLDGGRVLAGIVPRRMAEILDRIEPFGLVLLIVLLVTGLLGYVLVPSLIYALLFLSNLVGINPQPLFSYLFTL